MAEAVRAVDAAKPPVPKSLLCRVVEVPTDLAARLELAEYYIGYKDWEPALEQLMEIVQRDRAFQEDIGRRRMVEVFGLASSQPEIVSAWLRPSGPALNVR